MFKVTFPCRHVLKWGWHVSGEKDEASGHGKNRSIRVICRTQCASERNGHMFCCHGNWDDSGNNSTRENQRLVDIDKKTLWLWNNYIC